MAIGVAGLMVVAVGIVVIGRSSVSSGSLNGRLAWSVGYISNNSSEMSAIGSWLADGVLVRGTYRELIGYDAATGQQRWRLDAPTGYDFCGMSSRADNGTGAVGVARSAVDRGISGELVKSWHCENVWAVDARAGTVGMKTNVLPPKQWFDEGEGSIQPESVGGVAILPVAHAISGYDESNGRPRWKINGEFNKDLLCRPEALMSDGARAVTLWKCEDSSGAAIIHYYKVAWIDPANGKMTWSDKLPLSRDDQDSTSLANASPPVVLVGGDSDQHQGRLLVINGAGHVAATIAQQGPYGTLDLGKISRVGRHLEDLAHSHNFAPKDPVATQQSYNLIAGAGLLLARASEPGADLREVGDGVFTHVVAFDTATGQLTWSTRPDPDAPDTLSFVTAAKDGIIVLRDTNNINDPPPRLYRLSPQDGSPEVLSPELPSDFGQLTNQTPMLYWANNMLYAVQWDNVSPRRSDTAISAFT